MPDTLLWLIAATKWEGALRQGRETAEQRRYVSSDGSTSHGRPRGRTGTDSDVAHLGRLTALHPEGIPSAEINGFTVGGRPLKLVVQPGIWKPAELDGALTIRTTFTAPNQPPPYEDDIAPGGLVKYAYRGTDPRHSDNRALRTAMREQLPLAYFIGVARGVYQAQFPVFVVAERPEQHAFLVAVDETHHLVDPDLIAKLTPDRRSYLERLTRIRLHQPVFRARVLQAYERQCAIEALTRAMRSSRGPTASAPQAWGMLRPTPKPGGMSEGRRFTPADAS